MKRRWSNLYQNVKGSQGGRIQSRMKQSKSTVASFREAAGRPPKVKQLSPTNPETRGASHANLNLNSSVTQSIERKQQKKQRVNDNDRKLEASKRLADLENQKHLIRKWDQMPKMLREALQREERESVRFQTRLSTIQQQQKFQHLRTQASETNLRATDSKLRELTQGRETKATKGYIVRNSSSQQSDGFEQLNQDVTFNEPEIPHCTADSVQLNSGKQSREQLIKLERDTAQALSDPKMQATLNLKGQLGSSPSTADVHLKSIESAVLNDKSRSLSSKVRGYGPNSYEAIGNPSPGKSATRYGPTQQLEQKIESSRRSLFDPGHQFEELGEAKNNKKFSRTGVTTVKRFNESRDNKLLTRKEITIKNEEAIRQASARPIVNNCTRKNRNGYNNADLKLSQPRGSGLDLGYTTDLTTSRGRSECKRMSGTATGTQHSNKMIRYQSTSEFGAGQFYQQSLSQQKYALQTPHTIHTMDQNEALKKLNSLFDAKNHKIETLPEASLTLSHALSMQQNSKERAGSKQHLNTMRPISAQPFIKSRAYTIKNGLSKNFQSKHDGTNTFKTSVIPERESQAEIYHKLAAKTNIVFNQGLTGDFKKVSINGSHGQTLDAIKDHHPSQFTIQSRTQGPFGDTRHGSVFTVEGKNIQQEPLQFHSVDDTTKLNPQERQKLIKDLKTQLSQLQDVNRLYKLQLQKKKQSRKLGDDQSRLFQTVLSSQQQFNNSQQISDQTSFDLEEMFFDCIYDALKLRDKNFSKVHGQMLGRASSGTRTSTPMNSRKDNRSIDEKTNTLLKFVTNRHVLQILYDVMFRFQKIQSKEMHDDQGCLSNEFMKQLYDLKDYSFSVLAHRKTSVPIQSSFSSKKQSGSRFSRQKPLEFPSKNLAFTNWTHSNIDLNEQQSATFYSIPKTVLSRDEARKLALVKLNKKQKQDIKNMKSQLLQFQKQQQMQISPIVIQNDQHQPHGPTVVIQSKQYTYYGDNQQSQVPSAGSFVIDSNSQTQPDNPPPLHSPPPQFNLPSNRFSKDDGTSRLLVTDEAAVVQHIQQEDEKDATDGEEDLGYAPVQDVLLGNKIDQESCELSPQDNDDSAASVMNDKQNSDAKAKEQQKLPKRLEKSQPIDVQINSKIANSKQRKKNNVLNGQAGRTVKTSIVTEKHGQDSEQSHYRGGMSRTSSKTKNSLERKYRGKRIKTAIDSKKRSEQLKDHINYEQTINKNIQQSRQRQMAIMNALDSGQAQTPENIQTNLSDAQNVVVTQQILRPRSQKSQTIADRPNMDGHEPQQSTTLDVQRLESKNASVEIEPNNSSSHNDNNRSKRRSIHLNISNKNAKLSIQNKDKSPSLSHEMHFSRSNEKVLEQTGLMAPIPPPIHKPDSITMADVEFHPLSSPQEEEPIISPYDPVSEQRNLNLDLVLDAESNDEEDRKVLQLQGKEPTLYISQRNFVASLDDRPFHSLQDSAAQGGADQLSNSNQPKLDESKEYTDLRHLTHDPSDLGEHREPNQTSYMQQQVAPISSVHIANSPQIYQMHTEVTPGVFSELSGGRLPYQDGSSPPSYPAGTSSGQILQTISVRNIEQAPISPSQQHTYMVNQYQSSHFVEELSRPQQQATIISTRNVFDLSQFKVPTPTSLNVSQTANSRGFNKTFNVDKAKRGTREKGSDVMLMNLKKLDKKVRVEKASSKGGVNRSRK